MADKKIQSEDERALITPGHKRQSREIPDEVLERWKVQKEEFLYWISDGENMDVYQIASVLYQTRGFKNPETWKAMIKVLVCTILQIFGMVYLCFYFMFEHGEDEDEYTYCRMGKNHEENHSISLKILAVSLVTWICLVLADQMVEVAHYGLYSFGTQQPVFVNKQIIYLGIFANLFCAMTCWIASVALMYFSVNVIDLILNGIALYFIKDVDDEMVFGHDYEMMKKWFTDKYDIFVDEYIEKCDATGKRDLETMWNRDYHANPGRCWCLLSPLIIIAPLYLALCY